MNGYHQYFENDVSTRSPLALVIALYDGALKAIGRAKVAIANDNRAERGSYVSRALAIVHELSSAIDPRPAPELARTLQALYARISSLLVEANVAGSSAALDEAAKILTVLRSGWSAIQANERAAAQKK